MREVCCRIQSGDIKVAELRNIDEHRDQLRKICEASKMRGIKKEKELSYEHLQGALNQRLEEVREFEERHKYLSHLCDYIPHHVKGV